MAGTGAGVALGWAARGGGSWAAASTSLNQTTSRPVSCTFMSRDRATTLPVASRWRGRRESPDAAAPPAGLAGASSSQTLSTSPFSVWSACWSRNCAPPVSTSRSWLPSRVEVSTCCQVAFRVFPSFLSTKRMSPGPRAVTCWNGLGPGWPGFFGPAPLG
ncbi:MAG: hypothetical protein U0797_24280 [Gemmataceae bacterium]